MKLQQKVLIIRFSSFGDILLTMDVYPLLRTHAPEVEVHVLTKKKFASLLSLDSGPKQIHTIGDHASIFELLKVVGKLRTERYSLVVDLHNNLRSRIVSILLGVVTLRVNKHRVRELLLFMTRGLGRTLLKRPFSRALESRFLLFPSVREPSLIALDETKPSGRGLALLQLLPKFAKPIVCISSESAWKTKRWAHKNFVAVALQLKAQGFEVVWIGTETEPVISTSAGDCGIDLRAKLDILQTAQLLKMAELVVCNDTGILHLSEMVKTPVVSVFGPTTRELGFGPRLSDSVVIESADLWCRPCSKNGRSCHRLGAPQKCLTDVSVQEVINAALGRLTNTLPHAKISSSFKTETTQ